MKKILKVLSSLYDSFQKKSFSRDARRMENMGLLAEAVYLLKRTSCRSYVESILDHLKRTLNDPIKMEYLINYYTNKRKK